MKILVVGANGNVGTQTVKAALASGDEVIAYVRRPETVTPLPGLTVVAGDAGDTPALAAAARDADAVIVAITGSTKDATFMQRTLPNVIAAVRQARAGRLVLVSAFGSGETAEKASGFARLIYRTALARFFQDKAASDAMLETSGPDYTIAYPVNLKNAAALPQAAVVRLDRVGRVPGLPTLPYANVGTSLVDIAHDSGLSGTRVLITTPQGWKPA